MNPAILIIILFPFFFIGLWLFVTFILSKIGWSKMVVVYEYKGHKFEGKDLGTAGGRINGVNYNGVLELKANHHGLHIYPIKIFSAFHQPILIPWQDIHQGKMVNLMFTKYAPLLVFHKNKKMASFRLNTKQMAAVKAYLN